MAVSPMERRLLLNQLSTLAVADVRNLWSAAGRLSDIDFAAFVVAAYPEVVGAYSSAAGDMAAAWFEESVPGSAVVADPIPVVRLTKSAGWALGGDGVAGLSRLEGITQRAVFDGARDTTLVNVKRTGTRWARDARADSCAFCRLLATRTSTLYRSRDTAATKVHSDCSCLPIEAPNGYELPAHAQQWQDEYEKARANAGSGGVKQILAAWRTQSTSIT